MQRAGDVARGLFTAAVFLAAVYFLLDEKWFWGTLLLGWAVYRAAVGRLRSVMRLLVAHGQQATSEIRSNSWIRVTVYVEPALQHPAVADLYTRLSALKNLNGMSKEDWTSGLLERFRSKYGGGTAAQVLFRVHANIVWKDGKPDWGGELSHEWLLPTSGMRWDPGLGLPRDEDDSYRGLRLRIVVVNGVLKFQIGGFYDDDTPHRVDSLRWQRWQTIASFPLFLFPFKHALPLRFLRMDQLVRQATYENVKEQRRQLRRDSEKYLHVITASWFDGKSEKIDREFKERSDEWLGREGFQKSDYGRDWFSPLMSVAMGRIDPDDHRDWENVSDYSDHAV